MTLPNTPEGLSVYRDDSPVIVPHWYMYPPKGAYKPCSDESAVRSALSNVSGQISLYVHIPFCTMRCSFCTLYASSGGNQEQIDIYVQHLIQEVKLVSKCINSSSVTAPTIYFGGGTPSILTEHNINTIFESLQPTFNVPRNATISIEFSPDTTTEESAKAWHAVGATRASLGVQSFDDRLLAKMNRRHSGDESYQAIYALQAAGFADINIDLIYGHEEQTLDTWLMDLHRTLSSGATSATIHPLALRRQAGYGSSFTKNGGRFPQTERLEAMYAAALKQFRAAAWIPTSAVSFSSSGVGNPLEKAEASGVTTLGFGAGARTYTDRLHSASIEYLEKAQFNRVLDTYYAAVDSGNLPVASIITVSDEEMVRRKLLLGIVTSGIQKSLLTNLQPPSLNCEIHRILTTLEQDGLVREGEEGFTLTEAGLMKAAYVGFMLASPEIQNMIGFSAA